jgi:hypothetical protein
MKPSVRRALFDAEQGPTIAASLGGPTAREQSDHRLSAYLSWFGDADRLVVIGIGGESPGALEKALAWGLAHAGDRELWITLPQGSDGDLCADRDATRRRLPFLDAPIRLFTYDGDQATVVPPLAQSEVLDWAHTHPPVTHRHHLGDLAAWVDRLLGWADADDDLVDAHRASYLAWHCEGRMVLKVKRTGSTVAVSAGVHHTSDPAKAPLTVTLDGPLEGGAHHRVVAAASHAMADRLEGDDAANAEHLLQERLAAHHAELGLVARPRREVPAVRATGRRGFIDLLGVDSHQHLWVIETKIGPDEMLALQALDYWIWCSAHSDALAAHLGQTDLRPAQIDLLLARKDNGQLVGPYTAAQLEALDGSIPWRVREVDLDGKVVTDWGRRQVHPDAPRVQPPRYPLRLQEYLIERTPNLTRRVFHPEPGAGILAAARPHYEELASRSALHGFIDHVRSSQAFALNLFGTIPAERMVALWALLDPDVTEHDSMDLEWSDPDDLLAELQPARPHQTQVDVVLRGRTASGGVRWALIEVKLSETGFGGCSAFDASSNPDRDVCHQPGPWGGEPDRCWQLANHGGPHRRRYDEALPIGQLHGLPQEGCPFRTVNQPMRNAALARTVIDRGDAEQVTVALCAPDGNRNVWRQWADAKQVLGDVSGLQFADLGANAVAELSTERDELVDRYEL